MQISIIQYNMLNKNKEIQKEKPKYVFCIQILTFMTNSLRYSISFLRFSQQSTANTVT
jgi:hypothetical protein